MKNVNNKGFSLIELMIVVAIIGILATVAIPNFQKFQGKAKQSEAKSQLGGVYMAQKAFFAEYSFYSGQFGMIGFVPQGSALVYRITTGNNGASNVVDPTNPALIRGTNLPIAMNVGACVTTAPGCTNAAFGGILPIWSESPTASVSIAVAGVATTDTTFIAGAGARLGASVAQDDQWTITDANVLMNLSYGI